MVAGLPDGGSLTELEQVWGRMRDHGYPLQPVTLLMTLVHSTQEAYDLTHQWKLSNNEKRLGAFVVQHRTKTYSSDTPIKYYQDLVVGGAPRSSVLELLHYCGLPQTASEVAQWRVPRFPVNGKDLMGVGFRAGPEMGRVLHVLQERWKESYFTLSREELLEAALKTGDRQRFSRTS